MATAQQLVNWAASQIGVKENPANSNIVKYWDFYKEHCGKNYQGSPWCAAFVTEGMTRIGQWIFTTDEERFRYCPSLVNWAKKNGQWLDRDAVCQPGDIILFANKSLACHVGIVEKRLSSSQVQTIEGNTSATSNDNGGAVMRRVRTYGTVGSSWYILGFVRPPWSAEKTGAWKKNEKGWWFEYSDGTYPTNEWKKINDRWYWFDEKGYAVTGWKKISDKWYYFNKAGQGVECSMRTGWFQDPANDLWYYLGDGGEMKTGWIQDKGKWYYLWGSGDMAFSCAIRVGDKYYVFAKDGHMMYGDEIKTDENGALIF